MIRRCRVTTRHALGASMEASSLGNPDSRDLAQLNLWKLPAVDASDVGSGMRETGPCDALSSTPNIPNRVG